MAKSKKGLYIPNQSAFQHGYGLAFDPEHIQQMQILEKRRKEFALRHGKQK